EITTKSGAGANAFKPAMQRSKALAVSTLPYARVPGGLICRSEICAMRICGAMGVLIFPREEADRAWRDIEPDGVAGLGCNGVWRVDGQRPCRRAADDQALAVADEADAVDDTRDRRGRGLHNGDGFRTDHGNRLRHIYRAFNALASTRENE